MSDELKACMAAAIEFGALINVHRIECIKTELAAREKTLRNLYQAKLKSADPAQRRRLQQAQPRWLAYRDAWCRYEKSFTESAPYPEIKELFCRLELTVAHTERFQKYGQ